MSFETLFRLFSAPFTLECTCLKYIRFWDQMILLE